MSSLTIRQAKALAAYSAEIRKQEERARIARLNAARQRLVRRFVRDKSGWLFAAASVGAGFAIVVLRVIN